MLKHLKIKNLAVIDEAELDVASGFVCLTGESGAGKSVLIDALLLLGGQRASSELVRTGFDKAVVEAVFEVSANDPELELLETKELFLRREVFADGKSRAYVNGVMVPAGLMQQYGRVAFEIHGQHGQQRLLKTAHHLAIFDDQTGLDEKAAAFADQLAAFREAVRGYISLKDGEANRLKEIDFLHVQIGEIEEAGVSESDLDLDIRLKRARNSELIRSSFEELSELLNARAIPSVDRVCKLVAGLIEFQPNLKPYVEQVNGLAATLSELRSETNYWDHQDDGEPLHRLEERESVLNRLFMKYGRDVEEVLAELASLKQKRDSLTSASSSLDECWRALEKDYEKLIASRHRLENARDKAKAGFERDVKAGLKDLALNKSDFQVEHIWQEWKQALDLADLADLKLPTPELRFLFSSNPGEPVKPLSKVASGGELSRVLLALISAFKRNSDRLLVFDEIDAGLGGETAHSVGSKLAELGERHQVLCVTHFAQVARFAGQQIKLEKDVRQGRTFTRMAVCDYEQRVSELARLMAGDTASESLKDHARELLASTS